MSDWDDDILSDDDTDEGIIELVDIVEEGPGDTAEETIIELTEIVDPEAIGQETRGPDSDKEEAGIADLSLEIEAADDDFSLEMEGDDFSLETEEEAPGDLRLDIVREETDLSDEGLEEYELEADGLEPEILEGQELEGQNLEAQGLELGMDEPAGADLVEADDSTASIQAIDLSREQMEAAFERMIEKKFGDRVETILFEVLERVIEREIAGIKDSLQKDLDHIGNV